MVLNPIQPPTPVKYTPAPVASKGTFSGGTINKILVGNLWVQDWGAVASSRNYQNWNNSARTQQARPRDIVLGYNQVASAITIPESENPPPP